MLELLKKTEFGLMRKKINTNFKCKKCLSYFRTENQFVKHSCEEQNKYFAKKIKLIHIDSSGFGTRNIK